MCLDGGYISLMFRRLAGALGPMTESDFVRNGLIWAASRVSSVKTMRRLIMPSSG